MSYLLHAFFIMLSLNNIFSFSITGKFNSSKLPIEYMTPENDMLINNPFENKLYKFILDSNKVFYKSGYLLKTKDFPSNSQEDIKEIYFNFIYINATAINITYFNKKYSSFYIYNSNKENDTYSHISFQVIKNNKLILFLNSKKSNVSSLINIVEFDYKSEEKIKIIKTYNYFSKRSSYNCYCITTSNNTIICGLIELIRSSILIFNEFNYKLVLFKEDNDYEEINFKSISPNEKSLINSFGIFENYFMKLIPLENEKIMICNNDKQYSYSSTWEISCHIFQVQNNSKIVKLNSEKIYREISNVKYSQFSLMNYKDNQIILLNYNYKNSLNYGVNLKIIKILNNNTFSITIDNLYKISNPLKINLLKNNNNNLIFIIVNEYKYQFQDIGHDLCNNMTLNLYNGDEVKINFDLFPNIFSNNSNRIIFFNKNNDTNFASLKSGYNSILTSKEYNKNNIKYFIDLKDYDYIQKNKNYTIIFTSDFDEKIAQRCELTLNFLPCKEECDICTKKNECYDKNKKSVYHLSENQKKFLKYFFILPAVILFMFIIILFFSFAKCCIRDPLPNYGGNIVQNEMPLIQ